MYPLNMKLASPKVGFAVANDEAEHAALTGYGYEPPLVAAPQVSGEGVSSPVASEPDGAASDADPNEADNAGHTVASVRAQLDSLGIAYDRRFGLARLMALLPQ